MVLGESNMKKMMIGFMGLGLLLLCQTGWAEEAYVTNTSRITLRGGPNTTQKIVTMLRPDQRVEVLGSESGWSHVRFKGPGNKDLEGWVLDRFLSTRMPWKSQALSLEKENSLLKERLSHLEKNWKEVSGKEKGLTRKMEENSGSLEKLQKEYDALRAESAHFLELKKKYETTYKALKEAEETAKILTKENESLSSSHRNEWFFTGALVLFVGLIFGLIMGKQQKKRKSSYY